MHLQFLSCREKGRPVTACVDHWELAEKKLPSFQYLVSSKLVLVKADAAFKSTGLVFQCFIPFGFVYYHLSSSRYHCHLCFPSYTCALWLCVLGHSLHCVNLASCSLTYMQEPGPDEHEMLTILHFLAYLRKKRKRKREKKRNVYVPEQCSSHQLLSIYLRHFHHRAVSIPASTQR